MFDKKFTLSYPNLCLKRFSSFQFPNEHFSNILDVIYNFKNWYIFSECFPCEKPGHVCDPDTGRCVCPPLTQGKACEKCSKGSWDYHPYRGCRNCQCHPKGSASDQCDLTTGRCHCLAGFEGDFCDKCRPGYYNFPQCWPCNCDAAGTREDQVYFTTLTS